MPAVSATVGGSAANSFVTIAEMEAYCDARLNSSAWLDESDDDVKARALIAATRELNAKTGWIGERATDTQALAWPRTFAVDPDAAWPGWSYYSTTEIPQRVKDATCELALQFLTLGTTDFNVVDPTLNVRRKSVDVLSVEYFEPFSRAQGLDRFPLVTALLRPLFVAQSGASSAPILRG